MRPLIRFVNEVPEICKRRRKAKNFAHRFLRLSIRQMYLKKLMNLRLRHVLFTFLRSHNSCLNSKCLHKVSVSTNYSSIEGFNLMTGVRTLLWQHDNWLIRNCSSRKSSVLQPQLQPKLSWIKLIKIAVNYTSKKFIRNYSLKETIYRGCYQKSVRTFQPEESSDRDRLVPSIFCKPL